MDDRWRKPLDRGRRCGEVDKEHSSRWSEWQEAGGIGGKGKDFKNPKRGQRDGERGGVGLKREGGEVVAGVSRVRED